MNDTHPNTDTSASQPTETRWWALRTHNPQQAARTLEERCEEVFVPLDTRHNPAGQPRRYPLIPRVLFVRTSAEHILDLEHQGHKTPESDLRFWIYRMPGSRTIHPIDERSIHLLRLLTDDPDSPCRIYTPTVYTPGLRVRVTAGRYAGYAGTVKRIARNRHVVVSIEGLCLVILPFIHPDLLEPI